MRRRLAIRSPLAGAWLVALATVWAGVALVSTSAKATVDRSAQRFQAVEIPKGTNVLVGRVLDAGTGAPVAGAVVTIQGFFDASGRATAGLPRTREVAEASLPRNAMTNGDGYFLFRDLPSARYAISALAFGYVNSQYPIHVVEVNDGDKPTDVVLRALEARGDFGHGRRRARRAGRRRAGQRDAAFDFRGRACAQLSDRARGHR